MKRDYPRLTIEDFGRHLLDTQDLDPIYPALRNTPMPDHQRARWLVAYWCFYHAGFACWASEYTGPDFWAALSVAGDNQTAAPVGGRWPRGHERRHFRAEIARKSITDLSTKYPAHPELMVDFIMGHSQVPVPYTEVAARARSFVGFGPWMAFKVCDMLERIMGTPIDFTQAAVFMFDDPVKAAIMLFEQRNPVLSGIKVEYKKDVIIPKVVEYLVDHFNGYLPPNHNHFPRKIGLQEIETVLCKWKSHMNGHYPLYNDIIEIQSGVEQWSLHCDTAKKFLKYFPKVPYAPTHSS